jgi:hypothetical protein
MILTSVILQKRQLMKEHASPIFRHRNVKKYDQSIINQSLGLQTKKIYRDTDEQLPVSEAVVLSQQGLN